MHRFSFLILGAFLFIADQLSKWSITEKLIRPSFGEDGLGFFEWLVSAPDRLPFFRQEVTSFFNIVMVWNQGVSFGLFSNNSDIGPYILSAVSVIISLIFVAWFVRTHSNLMRFALTIVIAGALGNVLDRLRFGAVIDFLDFHAFGYHWPAFNIADAAIVCGVLLLMIYSFFFESHENDAKTDDTREIST